MQVSPNAVVSIHYTLTNDQGDVLDSSRDSEPLDFIQGIGMLIPGLEKELEGKKSGDNIAVTIQPEEGYGVRVEELVQDVPHEAFGMDGDLEVGMQFQVETDQGTQVVEITAITEEFVTVDGNHPLAGEVLNFDVDIIAVREATPEELDHGHVHGEGDNHH